MNASGVLEDLEGQLLNAQTSVNHKINILKSQDENNVLVEEKQMLSQNTKRKSKNVEVNRLLREWPKLKLDRQGMLIRQTSNSQVVLPNSLKWILRELHEKMGHLGGDRISTSER
jgi:hypothetical protein